MTKVLDTNQLSHWAASRCSWEAAMGISTDSNSVLSIPSSYGQVLTDFNLDLLVELIAGTTGPFISFAEMLSYLS